MRKIYCGTSGTNELPKTHKLSEIPVREEIIRAFCTYYQSDLTLRPAQEHAIFACGLFGNSDNVILATPTNSGKSLLSYLTLFQDAMEGKNVALVEPLRALAYEKAEELKSIAEILRRQAHIKVKIAISTGDYRLTDEFMNSKPETSKAGQGQIIIATPERLDAISRVKENLDWFDHLSAVCFDEAHLIGDSNRGPAQELLIAFLRTLQNPPRIILMSATLANPDELARWLSPCSVISIENRFPPLEKWVYCVDDGEELNDALISEILEVLQASETSVIVFVYQTAAAESFANILARKRTGRQIPAHDLTAAMKAGVAWFHANMSAATKNRVIHAMESGSVRVTVSTTALSMGINLPATHVYVRDVTFAGFKDLDTADLLQMLGRAGRGSHSGKGVVLLNRSNRTKEHAIAAKLTAEELPIIRSALLPEVRESSYGSSDADLLYIDRVGNQVIGALNRYQSVTKTKLEDYFGKTLCGDQFSDLDEILRCLIKWKLAYQNETTNEYALTALGQVSSRCYFPPITAGNLGQLIRDFLSDEPSGKHLAALAPIDFIIMLCLTSDTFRPVARYSQKLETAIANYMEALPLEEKSYLYRTWIVSEPESLWGSARVERESADAKKQVLQRVYTAMLIYDLSKGLPSVQLKNYYKIDIDEIQEKLRDNAIWLAGGVERLMNVRSFYYHLKENCNAQEKEIRAVNAAFKKASGTAFALIGNLKFRSKLGELMRGIKRVYPHAKSYPGEGTIKKLEAAGIDSLKDLVGKSADDLVSIGVRRQYVDLIAAYIRKRLF